MKPKNPDPIYDRASEYIDSPLMTQRLVYRRQLFARIEGNYGVYRTTVRVARKLVASCTCPSDFWPCKHVYAVRATWDRSPDSFFDLAAFLKRLAAMPKGELIDAMRQILVAYPESLTFFGVPGFEPSRDAESDE